MGRLQIIISSRVHPHKSGSSKSPHRQLRLKYALVTLLICSFVIGILLAAFVLGSIIAVGILILLVIFVVVIVIKNLLALFLRK